MTYVYRGLLWAGEPHFYPVAGSPLLMLYTCVHAAPLAFIDLKVLNVLASRACHTFCCSRAWLTPGAPRLLSTVALQPRELQILLAVRTSRGGEQKDRRAEAALRH